MDKYEPEIGQAVFGQPHQEFAGGDLLEAALRAIESELCRVQWNLHQVDYASPFGNTGSRYANDVFQVEAYSWNDEVEQPWNFKWRDIEVSWYKHCGRGLSVNRRVSPDEVAEMLTLCLASIRAEDVS